MVPEVIVGSFCSKDFRRVSWTVYVTGSSSSTSGSGSGSGSGERTRSRDIGAGDCRVSGENATGVAIIVARTGVRGLGGMSIAVVVVVVPFGRLPEVVMVEVVII